MTVRQKWFQKPLSLTKPVCRLTSAQKAILLDPDYLQRAVRVFQKNRRCCRTYGELISDAADFIMTAYKAPVIDMKRSKKKTKRAALEAHAAVSIYYRLIRVSQQFERNPNEHLIPMVDLPEEMFPAPELREAPREASRRLELLQAMLEFDDEHKQAQRLANFLVAFAKMLDVKRAAGSIGLTGKALNGLFRWARHRYRAVLA